MHTGMQGNSSRVQAGSSRRGRSLRHPLPNASRDPNWPVGPWPQRHPQDWVGTTEDVLRRLVADLLAAADAKGLSVLAWASQAGVSRSVAEACVKGQRWPELLTLARLALAVDRRLMLRPREMSVPHPRWEVMRPSPEYALLEGEAIAAGDRAAGWVRIAALELAWRWDADRAMASAVARRTGLSAATIGSTVRRSGDGYRPSFLVFQAVAAHVDCRVVVKGLNALWPVQGCHGAD